MAQGVYVLSDTHEHCRQRQGSRERVRPAQAGRSVSSRLDRRTLLDQLHEIQPARRKFTYRIWPQAGVVEGSCGLSKSEKKNGRVCQAQTEEQRQENSRRALQRARVQIRRDCLSVQADRLLTLTYRQNMTNRAQALKDYRRFMRKMRKWFPLFAAVVVLEYQERGAIHFHMAISGFYPVETVRKAWGSVVGKENGNIDISFKPDGKGNAWSKLAWYMAKYLGKELDKGRAEGEHRYFRFQIGKHQQEVYYLPTSITPEQAHRLLYETVDDHLSHLHPNSPLNVWAQPTRFGGYVAMGEREEGKLLFKTGKNIT